MTTRGDELMANDSRPPPEGGLHHFPESNRDFDFFYAGLEQARLLVQACMRCGALRNPPSPACNSCQSLDWNPTPLSGTGSVYSYAIHYHPPLPYHPSPHPIVLVDLDEGIRMIGAMDGTDERAIGIGVRVGVEFLRRGPIASFRFRPE